MDYNYGNLQNMLPLLGSIAGGNTMNNNQNFINQLAAAISTAVGAVNATSTTSVAIPGVANNASIRDHTPEPPPAPRFRTNSPTRVKPNRGTAPMDLENESETENLNTIQSRTANNSMQTTGDKNIPADKLNMGMPSSNVFMNGGFMQTAATQASGINATPYMFFPHTTAANAASTSAAVAANQMFMDPTTMMAAMQQMQQNYAANFATTMPNAECDLNGQQIAAVGGASVVGIKEVIKTKNCILFPLNPNTPPPTTRERPPGCRTIFVGGLPENSTEEIIREIFESCGEITTLRASKKNFCHIRYRHESSVDRAIYLSGYRVRISNNSEPANFGRLHVDYAQARDDLYDYECKQRQLQREQRHRERVSTDRMRSQSPPPIPHYSDHEASLVAEHLRGSETFIKAVQTIAVWLERGDCIKRNANMFYSMIQSTHAHVRRLHTDKQQLEEDLRKAREIYRKQMLTMSTQFTQIEKVFSAASHKKVWDHFTKAQRKNIDQWKKLALELRSVQIEDDEMEMSDDDRSYQGGSAKRTRYDAESLKEENDSLRCQLETFRSEMSHVRTDIKYDNDYREKQIKVLQETIRNMQTQLLLTKTREQKDAKIIVQLQRKLKEAGVKQLLLKTRIKESSNKRKDLESVNSEASEILIDEVEDDDDVEEVKINEETGSKANLQNKECRSTEHSSSSAVNTKSSLQQQLNHEQVIDIDGYKSDDDVNIIEDHNDIVEIHETDEDEKPLQSVEGNDKDIIDTEKNDRDENDRTDVGADEEKALIVPVNTKLVEESYEIEPKFLPFVEAQIIALVAAYLIVQPFGVSTESICVYLRKSMKTLDLQVPTLEQILTTYTNIFKMECEEPDAAEADTEAKAQWKFCGFLVASDEKEENTKNLNTNDKDNRT